MSDISKKIFSIEPDISDVVKSVEPSRALPLVDDAPIKRVATPSKTPGKSEPVPDFITRGEAAAAPAVNHAAPVPNDPPNTGWIMWTGLALSLVWVGAVLAYFLGLRGMGQSWSALPPMAITGVLLAVLLPLILITLLWVTLKRLALVSHEANQIAAIAHTLTHADDAALQSTQNLALGIKAELASVDAKLADTADRFSTLQANLSSETRKIDETGQALSERSEDVGRNLTLQRQALDALSGTFDSKMETLTASILQQGEALSAAIEAQREKLATTIDAQRETMSTTIEAQRETLSTAIEAQRETLETTIDSRKEELENAAKAAEAQITRAAETMSLASQAVNSSGAEIGGQLSTAASTVSSSQEHLSALKMQLSEMISRLQEEQTKLQTEMNQQVREITDATQTASESTELLMSSLKSGQDTIKALNTASLNTNDVITQQFEGLASKIDQAQTEATSLSEKTAARVQESLADTRRDLAKLETDMLALQAKLRNAKADNEAMQLGLNEPEQPEIAIGRLRLKPLDTDFPPVEPPRFTSKPNDLQADLMKPLTLPEAEPLNLGADMSLIREDDEIVQYKAPEVEKADVLRRPVPDAKGFGRAKSEDKSGWRWRDMLGGLERPAVELANADPAPMAEPAMAAPLSAPLAPAVMDGSDVVATLCQMQLAPSAIVDDGTIIEASNAYLKGGAFAMQANAAARLESPCAHLRDQLRGTPGLEAKFKAFTNQYAQKLAALPADSANLRADLGSAQGRAFLICAAAFKQ